MKDDRTGVSDTGSVDTDDTHEIVAIRPNQVKSATENNGDFSNDNEDIRFSRSGKQKSEEDEIAKNAKADGTYMKAPDGNPTRLSEKQCVQVRTKAFKTGSEIGNLATRRLTL